MKQLAIHVSHAIDELWSHAKIHRDISRGTSLRRQADGSFVLLDAGIAFDVLDTSITGTGLLSPHTPGFIAPEHTEPRRSTRTQTPGLISFSWVRCCIAWGLVVTRS
ncbi:MAG: hypothetical protein WDO24_29305 [Pseudomonadota bacterium]